MATVINFVGAPGNGKSTAAMVLAGIMKEKGYNVELVTESAKFLVFSESTKLLQDQLFVLAEQNKMLAVLNDKVDYIITDSPLFLSYIYGLDNLKNSNSSVTLPESFFNFVIDLHKSYDNKHILLHRNHEYVQIGRCHTEEESNKKQEEIINLMNTMGFEYNTFNTIDMKKNSLPDTLLKFCIDNQIIKNTLNLNQSQKKTFKP